MRVLVLGGTVFLGRAVVEAALEAGHEVTLFNRGESNPGLFPRVEHVRGDREKDLALLAGRRWDAAVDTCGYRPEPVRSSAEALTASVSLYVFISTISVYEDFSVGGITEESPLGTTWPDDASEGRKYGALKALAERAVREVMGDRALVVRPGILAGPHDPTDRFTYWPWRVARGGEVLLPGPPERLLQVLDVRDLAAWIVRSIEAQRGGTYNATGPEEALRMTDLFAACRGVASSATEPVWVSEDFLVENEVAFWSELPLCLPRSMNQDGFFQVDSRRARSRGLLFRPLEETVRATFKWAENRPSDHEWKAGITADRERAVIRDWRLRS